MNTILSSAQRQQAMSSGRSNSESSSTGTNGINIFNTTSTTHSINGTKTKGPSSRFKDEPGGYDAIIDRDNKDVYIFGMIPYTSLPHICQMRVSTPIKTTQCGQSSLTNVTAAQTYSARLIAVAPPSHPSPSPSSSSPSSSTSPFPLTARTWTHAAFTLYTPWPDTPKPSLAAVCTLTIGTHSFLDTKFFTISPSSSLSYSSDSHAQRNHPPHPHQLPPIRSPPHATITNPAQPPPSSLIRSQSRSHVVFEFKENQGARWLFPERASIAYAPATEKDSARITASFRLPPSVTNGVRASATMVITQATVALWEGLQLAVQDSGTINYTIDESKNHIPSHQSLLSSSPTHTPAGTYPPKVKAGSPTLPKPREPQDPQPPKRKHDGDHTSPSKRPNALTANNNSIKSSGSSNSTPKKSTSRAGASGARQKHCGYCGCTTTPMWRRGPEGPSTLCNACGVKWKHGKILKDSPDTSSSASSTATKSTPSSSSNTPPKGIPKPLPEPKDGTLKKLAIKRVNEKEGVQPSGATSSEERKAPIKGISKSHLEKRLSSGDTDRIMPVKKRHSSKAIPTAPKGPKMVSIHELESLHPSKTNGAKTTKLTKGQNGHSKFKMEHEPTSTLHQQQQPNHSSNSHHHPHAISGESSMPTLEPKTPPKPSTTTTTNASPQSLYTNNTATFPLPFPTISIAFGPNNAQYTYPNCAVILFENHFRIKLMQGREKTEIDVWKEGIEGTEFQITDVGDGESMIVMKALSRQYLTRFDKELLNPDRNESLIVFRFRERLDGGGPKVKPLLEHWLTTDIPVPTPPV
ncbi:hypothetical protein BGZ92_000172 [Podila epicladia]|nr:hypothetical protein BGZ92_000172 [Podila epicladia]